MDGNIRYHLTANLKYISSFDNEKYFDLYVNSFGVSIYLEHVSKIALFEIYLIAKIFNIFITDRGKFIK
jgi:hypothetical protein